MSDLIYKIQDTNVCVTQGDITQIKADALMTAINSEGLWFGGIDRAIQKVAGNLYHSQAAARMPLRNLQTIVAKGNSSNHNGQFDDVLFVVDDLHYALGQVIYEGLKTANTEAYNKIVIPTIRMGVMTGVVEKTPEEAIRQMGVGISEFMREYKNNVNIKEIMFVVYNDSNILNKFQKGLKGI